MPPTRTRCTPSRAGCSRATSTSTASAPTARSAPSGARRPRRRARRAALAFAFASCQQYEHGYYTAYKHMAAEDLDLVIHLGDYIYEYDTELVHRGRRQRARQLEPRDRQPRRLPRAPRPVQDRPGPAGRARRVPVARHLRRPRDRQQLGRRDPRGGDAARLLPAPPQGRRSGPTGSTCRCARPSARRGRTSRSTSAAATATWRRSTCWTRASSAPTRRAGTAPARAATTAATRRARSPAPRRSSGSTTGCRARRRRGRSSPTRCSWPSRDSAAGAGETFSMDAWDGYKVSRDKLLDFIETRGIANPIVITGDVHQNWADDLLRDFRNPAVEDPRLRVRRHVDLHHGRRQRQQQHRARSPRTRGSSTTASAAATAAWRSTSSCAAPTTARCSTSSAPARRSPPTARSSSRRATPA